MSHKKIGISLNITVIYDLGALQSSQIVLDELLLFWRLSVGIAGNELLSLLLSIIFLWIPFNIFLKTNLLHSRLISLIILILQVRRLTIYFIRFRFPKKIRHEWSHDFWFVRQLYLLSCFSRLKMHLQYLHLILIQLRLLIKFIFHLPHQVHDLEFY